MTTTTTTTTTTIRAVTEEAHEENAKDIMVLPTRSSSLLTGSGSGSVGGGLVQRRTIPSTLVNTSTESVFEDEEAPLVDNEVKDHDVFYWKTVEPSSYKRKSKSIRRFYKQQNMLIEKLQRFYNPQQEEETESSEPLAIAMAIHGSFLLNVILLTAKIVASIQSGSMSVIASAADSLLDILSGSVLVITHRLVGNQKPSDNFHYPQGKSRMEPIGVFAFAIIMMLSSMQIIIEAIRRLVSRPEIDLGLVTLLILGFTIISKAFACWYCNKVADKYQSSSAAAYAEDHRNDVLTNMVGVGAAVAAAYVPSLWWLDSAGAIGIALYIIVCWLNTGAEQLQFLTGRGASPFLLQQLTYIAANHDNRIKFVDTVRAYHFGVRFLVEVDIVLPQDMPLQQSHDIGESLQHRLEELEDVERAFVHNDFEWDHAPVELRGTRIIRK